MQGHMLRGTRCTLTMVSDGVWVVDPNDTTPIYSPRVDAAMARVALVKYDYVGFASFIRAKAAMQEEEDEDETKKWYAPISEYELRHLLPMGVTGWVQVTPMSKQEWALNELLRNARLAIYTLENVVTSTELPYINSDTQWIQIRRRRSMYRSNA